MDCKKAIVTIASFVITTVAGVLWVDEEPDDYVPVQVEWRTICVGEIDTTIGPDQRPARIKSLRRCAENENAARLAGPR